VDITKTITHLSLCSGYEGIGLGLRRVLPNLREIAYVEREGFPVANLVAKMEAGELDAAPVFTDVKTFPYRKFRGCVDILSGGFPCQPFSAAGKRKATEDPRHLFPYIADGIRECQPRIVFLENVAGIISAKTGDGESVLQYVLKELEGLGYRATAGIFSAEEVGAPHQRKRVFILGMANSECGGMRGGRSSQERRDDSKWIQSNEGKRNELRSEVEGCGDSSRTELGYSEHMRESQPKGGEQDKRGRTQHSSQELGNSADLRLQQSSQDPRETSTDQSGEERRMYESQGASSLSRYGSQSQGSPELANSNGKGLEGVRERNDSQGWEASTGHLRVGNQIWPSRPGEPQYDWEEPRVVADSKSQQGSPSDNGGEPRASSQSEESESGGGHSGSLRESNGQAEPQLGGASYGSTRGVDATANRVDRLRLLGNGVVNQTAAKAFVTLIQRLI